MKNILSILILIALLAIIALQLKSNKETVENKVYHFDKEQAINVETQKLTLKSESDDYQIAGNFMPNHDAKINSEMQGKITSILVDEGNVVKKGQRLIKLDDELLKLQLKTLDVQINGLKVDINRFKILAKADAIQGVQLEKAELGLQTANSNRNTILEQIKKTSIYAPFNGVVTMKMIDVGSFANPGIPLLQLTDLNKMKFTINVPESDLYLFELNKMYKIKVDALPNIDLQGKTTLIGSRSNMGNSFPVQFEIKNTKNQSIKAGMFGKLQLDNKDAVQKIVIPASTIIGSSIEPQVYIVKNGKSILQNIVISKRVGNNVIVESGLKEGDEIVLNGFINLYDGANINHK